MYLAAFNYLVNQGNTPTTPQPTRNAFISSSALENSCGLSPTVSLILSNEGTGSLSTVDISYSFSDGTQGNATWTGTLAPGANTTFTLPAHSFASTGIYELEAEISQINGQQPYYFINNKTSTTLVIVEDPQLSTTGANVCIGSSALISGTQASTDNTIHWYDAETGGNLLGEGSAIVTPALSSSFIFYAAAAGKEKAGAEISASVGGATFAGTESFLKFDCFTPFNLRSVRVNSIESGTRVIQLRDSSDQVLATKIVDIDQGDQLVELGFNISPGKSYRLGLGDGGITKLLTAISNYSFPYTVPEIMSITGSSNGFYPFFFDWEVSWELPCTRVPTFVSASAGTTDADFSISDTLVFGGQNISFTDQSNNANKWLWDFGDGSTSTSRNPSHTYSEKGTYTVSLMATGSQNCSDAISKTITVATNTGLDNAWKELGNIKVYPNPNSGLFTIDLDLSSPKSIDIHVTDMLGNQIFHKKAGVYLRDHISLDLTSFADGIYLLKLDLEGIGFVEKIVKLK